MYLIAFTLSCWGSIPSFDTTYPSKSTFFWPKWHFAILPVWVSTLPDLWPEESCQGVGSVLLRSYRRPLCHRCKSDRFCLWKAPRPYLWSFEIALERCITVADHYLVMWEQNISTVASAKVSTQYALVRKCRDNDELLPPPSPPRDLHLILSAHHWRFSYCLPLQGSH